MIAQLAAVGIEAVPGSLAPEAIIVQGASAPEVAATDAFRDGLLYFQDEASQLVAHLANPKPGERILDLCSAPGGKATHMAELANSGAGQSGAGQSGAGFSLCNPKQPHPAQAIASQATILATDISPERLKLVQANIDRLQSAAVQVVKLDNVASQDNFDLILIDAPCSGFGTLRRNPEIRYRCSPEAITTLAARQLEMLNNSAGKVRPGGRIVYSTCTISNTENSGVVTTFLQQNPDFSLSPSDSEIPATQQLCQPDGLYRTWPTHLEMDGFEAAVLIRNTN